jgi:hypothetical protein
LFEATKNTVNALLAGETILDIERDESEDDEDSPMDDEAIAFRE